MMSVSNLFKLLIFCLFFVTCCGLTEVNSTSPPLVTTTLSTTPKTTPNPTTTTVPTVTKVLQNATSKPVLGESKGEEPKGTVNFFSFFGSKNAIGDPCSKAEDCKIKEAFCVNGKCECSTEYVASKDKRRCLIKANSILDTCLEDVQCEAGLNATGLVSCIAFKCICDFDATLSQGKCYKRLALGNKCEHDAECAISYSACIQNICACRTNMEPDTENERCIVLDELEPTTTNCTDDHMCSIFGELYYCRDGACVCKPGYHLSGRKCFPELRLGEYCEENSDCIIDVAVEKSGIRECRDNVCTCIQGYRADKEVNLCKSGVSLIAPNVLLLISIWLAKLLH